MIFCNLAAKPQPMPRSMFNPGIAAKLSSAKRPYTWWKKLSNIISSSLVVYRSKPYQVWRDNLAGRIAILVNKAKWYRATAGPVGLRITIHGKHNLGDGDKLIGTIFDALQITAIGDDCQITDFDVKLRMDDSREIELELYIPDDPDAAKWAESGIKKQDDLRIRRYKAAAKRRCGL
jgi:Holliday junction resolvase RusA-like endonuclease